MCCVDSAGNTEIICRNTKIGIFLIQFLGWCGRFILQYRLYLAFKALISLHTRSVRDFLCVCDAVASWSGTQKLLKSHRIPYSWIKNIPQLHPNPTQIGTSQGRLRVFSFELTKNTFYRMCILYPSVSVCVWVWVWMAEWQFSYTKVIWITIWPFTLKNLNIFNFEISGQIWPFSIKKGAKISEKPNFMAFPLYTSHLVVQAQTET